MIIQNRSRGNYFLVRRCARRVFTEESRRWKILVATAVMGGAAVVILLVFQPLDRFKMGQSQGIREVKTEVFLKPNPEITDPIPETQTLSLDDRIASADFSTPNRIQPEAVPGAPERVEEPLRTEKIEEKFALRTEKIEEKFPLRTEKIEEKVPLRTEKIEEKVPLRTEKIEEKVPMVASVDTAVEDTPADLAPELTYATILGRITLKRKETLSRIIRQVYGGFNSDYLKSFIIANPEIENPDRVAVGQIISLPAIPAEVAPEASRVWWIKIEETDTLEGAFDILRNHPGNFPPVRLIPYWNPVAGPKFAVVLDKLFKDEKSARTQQEQLPAELSTESTILSRWDKKTVFFANPYFDRTP